MSCASTESPRVRFTLRLALVGFIAVVAVSGAQSRARADAPPASEAEDRQRPRDYVADDPAAVEEPRGLVGLRLLAPLYLSDIELVGGRDYVSADALPGVGLGLHVTGRVAAGLTLGLTAGLAYNAVMRRSDSEANDSIFDFFVALLVGYRATIAELVLIGASLGVGYHTTQDDGGATGLAEVELGLRVAPTVIVGVGCSAEVLMGINQESGGPRHTGAARRVPVLIGPEVKWHRSRRSTEAHSNAFTPSPHRTRTQRRQCSRSSVARLRPLGR